MTLGPEICWLGARWLVGTGAGRQASFPEVDHVCVQLRADSRLRPFFINPFTRDVFRQERSVVKII